MQPGVLRSNSALKDLHAGKRCFLLFTGASLNEVDVRALDGELTFGCGHLHNPQDDWRLRYHNLARKGILRLSEKYGAPKRPNLSFHFVSDRIWPLFISANLRETFRLAYMAANDAYDNPETIFFVDAADRRFLRRHRLLEGRRVHYVKPKCPIEEARVQSVDLTKRVTMLDGSIFAMMAIAMYMGFRELYLCGAGYTYRPLRAFHYYDEPVVPKAWPPERRQWLFDQIRQDSGTEPWRIREDGAVERPTWVRWAEPSPVHRIVREFADSQGVRIYNVVPEGFESPVYEAVSWLTVQDRILSSASPACLASAACCR